jgi:hypothetical protein
MIDVQEHWYDDDPKVGHPDVRTVLEKVEYFFLGNGLIQAAIQWAGGGEGTSLGFLIMDPERLGKKREALSMDPLLGLDRTIVEVRSESCVYRPGADCLKVGWEEMDGIPAVRAEWGNAELDVVERFYVPRRDAAVLERAVRLSNRSVRPLRLRIRTEIRQESVERPVILGPGEEKAIVFVYTLVPAVRKVTISAGEASSVQSETRAYWDSLASASFGHPLLDRFFGAARAQLPAAVSRTGRADGSIWQYNREWLRDQAVVARALAMLGERDLARTMFDRLLTKFVTDNGDTIDSSETRAPAEVELDQNGFLLESFRLYVLWTGDLELAKAKWDKIVAAAEFPIRPVFRHEPSGLLMNRREFWERHHVHGIEPGIELVHQLFESAGLSAAADIARMLDRGDKAAFWGGEAARLKRAMLEDPVFRMVDNRGFIKRRRLNGLVQERAVALEEAGLPDGVPLSAPGDHFLNPDTSAALPIALEFVPMDSPLVSLTLSSLEALWNQAWSGGGYGRYHYTSEPDSPGPWPFPSLFVARAAVEAGDYAKAWRVLEWMNSVPGAKAGAWFEFYGRRLAPPFPQVGIIPWTWAEMILLLVHHVLGLRPEANGLRIRPRLLPGMGPVQASFPVREGRVVLEIAAGCRSGDYVFETKGRVLEKTGRAILIAYPEAKSVINIFA